MNPVIWKPTAALMASTSTINLALHYSYLCVFVEFIQSMNSFSIFRFEHSVAYLPDLMIWCIGYCCKFKCQGWCCLISFGINTDCDCSLSVQSGWTRHMEDVKIQRCSTRYSVLVLELYNFQVLVLMLVLGPLVLVPVLECGAHFYDAYLVHWTTCNCKIVLQCLCPFWPLLPVSMLLWNIFIMCIKLLCD